MTWLFIGAGVILALIVLMMIRARSIARRHSVTLSQVTGIPADQIYREMTQGNLTPGEWAARHDLDPMTFLPRG